MSIASVGIDLGKTTFHLVSLDSMASCGQAKVHPQATAGLHGKPAKLADWH
jgi:hypothetical protein